MPPSSENQALDTTMIEVEENLVVVVESDIGLESIDAGRDVNVIMDIGENNM